MILHSRTHPTLDVDDCFACRVASVHVGAAALPTRAPDTVATIDREKRWSRDIPAYRALRKDGLQPRSSDGAHRLMTTATTREQVEGLPKLHKDRAEVLSGDLPKTAAS